MSAARRDRERVRRSAIVRRRRLWLATIAALATIAGALAGGRKGDEASQSPATAEAPSCPPAIAADRARLAGQMLLVRMEATATPGLLRAARRGEIGGVVLFPAEATQPGALGREVARLRRAAEAGGAPPPLVAIDQEGGEVKRLNALPPDRSPAEIAAAGVRAAAREGAATGAALRRIGVDVDLAPVLDVPASPDAAIASRAFSDDARTVASLGTSFIAAIQREGVAATAKHFPGLGPAAANTDLAPTRIDLDRAKLRAALRPFAAAAGAGVDLVMVSNATYPAVDARQPASLSRRAIGSLLRGRLGYEGVVVTDDLGAGALTGAGYDEGAAAVGAADAGADLLLFALSHGAAARRALIAAIRDGRLSRRSLIESCARTTALRERLASATDGG